MRRYRGLLLTVVVAACAPRPTSTPAPQPSVPGPAAASPRTEVRATAAINDVANTTIGNATFTETAGGLLVAITISGLGIGPHGVHLHSVGSCVAPSFTSAGPHFNPGARQHGFRNPAGYHAGDMPNLVSPPAGAHRVQVFMPGVRLTGRGGLLDDDGASIVVHTAEDDHMTDPAGDSGGRFACGVITRARP